jgi:hypothetical protein
MEKKMSNELDFNDFLELEKSISIEATKQEEINPHFDYNSFVAGSHWGVAYLVQKMRGTWKLKDKE